jgi:PncC family amidohydrolase
VIAYSNRIKEEILGVQSQTLVQHGAVSKETACEMAKGIRKIFEADIGVATTGIAGPTGGTPTKPVGLVWIGISTKPNTQAFEYHFKGSRNDVKTSTVKAILTRLLDQLK